MQDNCLSIKGHSCSAQSDLFQPRTNGKFSKQPKK